MENLILLMLFTLKGDILDYFGKKKTNKQLAKKNPNKN